jgi:hypothetical protein
VLGDKRCKRGSVYRYVTDFASAVNDAMCVLFSELHSFVESAVYNIQLLFAG